MFGSRRILILNSGGGGGGGDTLDPIYAIDPNAKVWVHTRGMSAGELDPVPTWETANGNATLIQATTSKQPVRYSDGVYWDGIDDIMTADTDGVPAVFSGAHSVLLACRDISTANNIRTTWIAAQPLLSTSVRDVVAQNIALGTSALLTRLRVTLGGTSVTEQIDATSLYSLGPSGTFSTAFTSPDKSTLGTARLYRTSASPTLLDDGAWPPSTFAPTIFTVGAERINTSFAPSNFWQGTLSFFIVFTKELSVSEIGEVYAAMAAEGVFV